MMHSVRILGVAILFAAFTIPLSAQRLVTQPIDSGALVRLRLLSGQSEAGRLLSIFGPDSLMFRYEPHAAPIIHAKRVDRPAADVAGVDIAVGSRAMEGFGSGMLTCGIITVPLGLAVAVFAETSEAKTKGLLLFGGATLACGALGALSGSRSPRWDPAP